MKAYVRWMNCHNYQVEQGLLSSDRLIPLSKELINLPKEEICLVLCKFVMEAHNSDGKDYTRDTLYDLIIMVQSFLKQNGKPMKFLEEDVFFDLKNALDNRMRDLSKDGKISPRIKAEPLSVSDEEKLWSLGILGDKTPEQLVDTLLYLNSVHFALRAAEEHKSLKMNCQFKVEFDPEVGLKYLQYTECMSKCNQGGLTSRFIQTKVDRAYENVINSDRYMVCLYEKYVSHRPNHLPKYSKDFYLHPLAVPNGNIWYSCQARGRHNLDKVVKTMCAKAGFTGKCTNHSLRSSTATCMYEKGIDEQLICEKTGHRSVAVRSYKRTSSRQMKEVCDVLYGNTKPIEPNVEESEWKVVKREPCATVSKPLPGNDVDNNVKVKQELEPKKTNVELPNGMVVNINFNVNK